MKKIGSMIVLCMLAALSACDNFFIDDNRTISSGSGGNPGSACTITSFSLESTAGIMDGSINGTSIEVKFPAGADTTSLIATFTFQGASVTVGGVEQTSGVSMNNFDSPVTYRVTAQDGTSRNYLVTVEVGAWVQDAYLKAANVRSYSEFGKAIAVSGGTIVVGAYAQDENSRTIVDADDGTYGTNFGLQNDNLGAAYVYKKDGVGNWVKDAYLKASNAEAGNEFGKSVAISGDLIVVGAPGEKSNLSVVLDDDMLQPVTPQSGGTNIGAAYVYMKKSGVWVQDAYLKPSNATTDQYFGYAVAVSGETIVVGAFKESNNQTLITNDDTTPSSSTAPAGEYEYGAAYVYSKKNGIWVQDAYLKPSNQRSLDHFGLSVAIKDTIIVIGSQQADDSQTTIVNDDASQPTVPPANAIYDQYGAAYVFTKDGSGNWVQDAYLKASNARANDFFGTSVAIDTGTIVVGALGVGDSSTTVTNDDGHPFLSESNDDMSVTGAAYVFKRNPGGDWVQDAYLKASNARAYNDFGLTVGISGDLIVVGAFAEGNYQSAVDNRNGHPTTGEAATSELSAGAAYLYRKNALGDWVQEAYLKASNTFGGAHFGTSVAIDGSTVVAGAESEASDRSSIINTDSQPARTDGYVYSSAAGAAYVFTLK